MRRVSIIVAACAALAVAPAAYAQGTPDNSGVDEYSESIPGATGDHHVQDNDDNNNNGGGGGGGGSAQGGDGSGSEPAPGTALPPGTVDQLEAQGPDGVAAAALAERSAPGQGGQGGSGDNDGPGLSASGSATAGSTASKGSDGTLNQILTALTGGEDGMGFFLPVILALALVGAISLVLLRRRGPGEPGSA